MREGKLRKIYRPANGSEGEIFEAKWCSRCKKDDPETESYCDILSAAMAYNIGDENYPVEWVEDDTGPMCMAFDEGRPMTKADKKYLAWKNGK